MPKPTTTEPKKTRSRRTPIEKAIDALEGKRARIEERQAVAVAKVRAKYAAEIDTVDRQIEALRQANGAGSTSDA